MDRSRSSLILPCEFLLPDKVLKTLAHNATLKTTDDILTHFSEDAWPLRNSYAANVSSILEEVDHDHDNLRERPRTSSTRKRARDPSEEENNPPSEASQAQVCLYSFLISQVFF